MCGLDKAMAVLAGPTGTLRTAAPPRPIVILAAAGIQSPYYV